MMRDQDLRTRENGRAIDPSANGFDRSGAQKTIEQRLKEIGDRGNLTREAEVGVVDMAARTVELSFSSETESVERWFGIEILGHDAEEVDLSRLNNAAPLLWMHNWRDQRGVVENARIDGDKVGRAVVRLSRSKEGEQLLQDINDKIITKVSVGYSIQGLRLIEERDDVPVYRINHWTPMEISMVSVPADDTVGVGRTAEIPQEEVTEPTRDKEPVEGLATRAGHNNEVTMLEKITRDGSGNLVRAKVDENGKIVEVIEVLEKAGQDVTAARAAGGADERSRVNAISKMGNDYGRTELALEHIRDGKSAEAFQQALLGEFAAERAKAQSLDGNGGGEGIGLTDKEKRQYSLLNVVRALANPQDRAAQDAAKFEIECSAEAQRQSGREAKGILIPSDILDSRAFNAGGMANTPTGAATGANLVATDFLAGSFIEMLRNRTAIMQLGTTMSGLVGDVEIPKQTGGATAYWVGEGDDATEGAPTIGQIKLSPKTVAAYTDISRKLLRQSTPDAEGIVVNDLNRALALAIDSAGWYGSGTNDEPMGIKNYTGINAVDFATQGKPTFAELVAMETAVASDNADLGSLAYALSAATRGWLKTTPKFGTGTESTIWEAGNTVNGYRTEVSNQINSNDVFYGNFADLIIAMWGGLDLTVDPYSLSKSGGLRLVVFQDVDFVLRRVESICWGSHLVS